MDYTQRRLASVVQNLSDQNYERSVAFYRLWFDIGATYSQFASDQIFNHIWNNRGLGVLSYSDGKLFHPTAHLVTRFASDAESDSIISLHTAELRNRLCTKVLEDFFDANMECVSDGARNSWADRFITDANIIAYWANLGFLEESAIHNHILQSLIDSYASLPKLYDHQADAIIILFKIAGATFEAYADPLVVDCCFELLKGHYDHTTTKGRLVQEVLDLRDHGWEGLPPPPVFTAQKHKAIRENQGDPAITPIATPLGLPDRGSEPQIPRPPQLEATVQEIEVAPVSPVTQSPSISIATLSDFTIADTSDDETPIDPTAITRHDKFYLEDGNVEVLCGNTLFRVHTSILSFHSPALRQMFVQANLAAAESPNGCPRILSSDAPTDFATLLKMIYLPGFPERNKAPDFNTFSSLLRITTKYEMPTIRSQLIEVVRDSYPETFDGVTPTKTLGEDVFDGPTPHPNEVVNLFVQQKLTSALPMAYYMAARRGVDSLMDEHLPRSATLSPRVLRTAIKGFITLREVELKETHQLVFGSKRSGPCSLPNCLSRTPASPAALEAYQKVFDHIVGSSDRGTKVLQVPELCKGSEGQITVGICPDICENCERRWKYGHADLRERVWAMLPDAFGLKG